MAILVRGSGLQARCRDSPVHAPARRGSTWHLRTCVAALHESAFGGKADMTIGTCPLSRSLLGVKRTWPVAAHMSAYDPKRTSAGCHALPVC